MTLDEFCAEAKRLNLKASDALPGVISRLYVVGKPTAEGDKVGEPAADVARAGQYSKKPIVITASQWFENGDHPNDYDADHDGLEGGELRSLTGAERKANGWEGDVVRYYRHPAARGDEPCEQCGKPHRVHGWIDTLEQGHRVCPGDWIITGVAGERYPCKPAIFEATYEPALQVAQASDLAGEFYAEAKEPAMTTSLDRKLERVARELAEQRAREAAARGPRDGLTPMDNAVEPDLPDGVWARVRGRRITYMATCRACERDYELNITLDEFDPEYNYCGRSPRCLP